LLRHVLSAGIHVTTPQSLNGIHEL
jgi:hypothetical protein